MSRTGYEAFTSTYLLPLHNSKFNKNIRIYVCDTSVLHVYTTVSAHTAVCITIFTVC